MVECSLACLVFCSPVQFILRQISYNKTCTVIGIGIIIVVS